MARDRVVMPTNPPLKNSEIKFYVPGRDAPLCAPPTWQARGKRITRQALVGIRLLVPWRFLRENGPFSHTLLPLVKDGVMAAGALRFCLKKRVATAGLWAGTFFDQTLQVRDDGA